MLSHWSVMVEGTSHIFSSGPAVVERALGQRPSKDDLGGAEVAVPSRGIDFDAVRRPCNLFMANIW